VAAGGSGDAEADGVASTSGKKGGAGTGSGGVGGRATDANMVDVNQCQRFCRCMAGNCSTALGYPYVNGEVCLQDCLLLSLPELDCWTWYCFQAPLNPSQSAHFCEHAWGGYGLDEC
jgi:hypothetical protein